MIDFIKDADCTKETPVKLGVPDAPIYGKGIKLKPTFGGGLMESITMRTQPQVSVKPMLQIMVLLMTLRQHLMKIQE